MECKVAWFYPNLLEGMIYDIATGECFTLSNVAALQLKELLSCRDAPDTFEYEVSDYTVISIRV